MPVPAAADERSGRKAHPHTSLSLNSQPPEIVVSSFAPRTRAGRELDAPPAQGQKPSGLNRIPEFPGVRQTGNTSSHQALDREYAHPWAIVSVGISAARPYVLCHVNCTTCATYLRTKRKPLGGVSVAVRRHFVATIVALAVATSAAAQEKGTDTSAAQSQEDPQSPPPLTFNITVVG